MCAIKQIAIKYDEFDCVLFLRVDMDVAGYQITYSVSSLQSVLESLPQRDFIQGTYSLPALAKPTMTGHGHHVSCCMLRFPIEWSILKFVLKLTACVHAEKPEG